MRPDIKPGARFPDFELPDHKRIKRKLSEIQGEDPMILTPARGHYCPKEHQQDLESLDLRIERKLDLWNALRAAVGDRVDGVDFDEQIHRAELQRELLGRRRLDVAADAHG